MNIFKKFSNYWIYEKVSQNEDNQEIQFTDTLFKTIEDTNHHIINNQENGTVIFEGRWIVGQLVYGDHQAYLKQAIVLPEDWHPTQLHQLSHKKSEKTTTHSCFKKCSND